jgi:glycosyltransferase involved in cell wall biosynthesis
MSEARRAGGVVLGDLDADSGLRTLLAALEFFPAARIAVIGEVADVASLGAHPQLSLAGALEGHALRRRLQRAAYLVVPASDGELRPLVDAFANGLAVIAPEEGLAADLIEPGRNGLLYEPGSARDLARRLAWAEAFAEKIRQMGECARADYRARFIAHWSYRKLYGEQRRSARA